MTAEQYTCTDIFSIWRKLRRILLSKYENVIISWKWWVRIFSFADFKLTNDTVTLYEKRLWIYFHQTFPPWSEECTKWVYYVRCWISFARMWKCSDVGYFLKLVSGLKYISGLCTVNKPHKWKVLRRCFRCVSGGMYYSYFFRILYICFSKTPWNIMIKTRFKSRDGKEYLVNLDI